MTLGEKIKQLRIEKGWKQPELAKHSGISRISIGYYERNERTPGTKQIEDIAAALGVSPVELMSTKKWNIPEEHVRAIRDQLSIDKALEGTLLGELSIEEREKLLESLSLVLDCLVNKIAAPEERAAAIERMSDIIFAFGQMILSSFEMGHDGSRYLVFIRNYDKAMKQLNNHREALIQATLNSLDDDADLRKLIFGEGDTEQ